MNLSSTTTSNKIKYKIVFLGDQFVGKSSIIEKYIHNKFDQSSNPTVGIDFLAKNITYKTKTFRLQLWDTAGQERFKSLIPSYLKDANCAIIVYDVTNKATLENAQKWLKLYSQNKTIDGCSVLVGNKIDLAYRTVTQEQGRKLAQQLNIQYYEMSAKSGSNVQQLFLHMIDLLMQNKTNGNPKILQNIVNQIKQQQRINEQQNTNDPEITIKPLDNSNKKQFKHQETYQNQTPSKNIVLDNREVQQFKIPNKKKKCC